MSRVILITGCSSGFGREIALLFAQKKWKVIATMRNIEDETFLKGKDNITRLQLDVTNSENIKSVVEKSINAFNQIDVLVNNAGYGTFGFFEEASEEEIMKQINTNQLSMIRMMQVILPHFRKNKRGKIINISSSAGRFSLPYTSLYNMTKFAIEGLSESLYYEYLLWNINVKIIEPGYFKTKFYDSALFHRGKTINDFDALRKVKTTKLEKIFQKVKLTTLN